MFNYKGKKLNKSEAGSSLPERRSLFHAVSPPKFSRLQYSGFHLTPSYPSANLPAPFSSNSLAHCQERTASPISAHWIICGLGYSCMGITSKMGKKNLPDCPSNSLFRFPKEKIWLYLPCASLPPPALAITPQLRRDRGESSSRCPLSRGRQNLLPTLPKLPAPPGQRLGGLSLPKHTQLRGYVLSTNTAPLQSNSGRRVGGRGRALCDSLPLLGIRTPCVQTGVP